MNNFEEDFAEDKEICFECKHIKYWHRGNHCIQPGCECNRFIESHVSRGMTLFEAYEKGKEDAQMDVKKRIRLFKKKLEQYRFCTFISEGSYEGLLNEINSLFYNGRK